MICRQCLRRATALRPALSRTFTTTPSTSSIQPFSAPLSSTPNPISHPKPSRPKTKSIVIPTSSCAAGTPLKGLNFFKGKEDPLALPEEEYPEWLWTCLDGGKKSGANGAGDGAGDIFAKSKKQRRAAAKTQRKLEAQLIASGNVEALAPKIPLQQQSIDLPWNEKENVEGALEAAAAREEVRSAMRQERRSKIKESNFLKGMR